MRFAERHGNRGRVQRHRLALHMKKGSGQVGQCKAGYVGASRLGWGIAVSNEVDGKCGGATWAAGTGPAPSAASPAAVAALRHHWGAALGDDLRRGGSGAAGMGTRPLTVQGQIAASIDCYHPSCPSYCNANRICLACRSRTQRDALPSPLFSHWTRFRSAGVAWRQRMWKWRHNHGEGWHGRVG